jgi:hypothetical protein
MLRAGSFPNFVFSWSAAEMATGKKLGKIRGFGFIERPGNRGVFHFRIVVFRSGFFRGTPEARGKNGKNVCAASVWRRTGHRCTPRPPVAALSRTVILSDGAAKFSGETGAMTRQMHLRC